MPDYTINVEAERTYINVNDATPGEEIYLQVNTRAIPPNDSTFGPGFLIHKTIRPDGTQRGFGITEDMFPDLPREVVVNGKVASLIVTSLPEA